jgi:hypothetical protein
MPTPTPIPAFAPVDSPSEPEPAPLPPGASPVDVPPGADEEMRLGALVGAVVVPGGVVPRDTEEDDGGAVVAELEPLALPVAFAQMAKKSPPTATLT